MQSNAVATAPVKTKRVVQKRTLELEADRREEAVVGTGTLKQGKGQKASAAVVKRDQVTTVKP